MSAPVSVDASRRRPLLASLFWAGVGLAAFAALLLVFGGNGGVLRVAAVLALSSFVLLGLSVMLRPDPAHLQRELAEAVSAELDAIREEVRAAEHVTARPLHDRLRELHAGLEALRGQLDAIQLGAPPNHRDSPYTGFPGDGVAGAMAGHQGTGRPTAPAHGVASVAAAAPERVPTGQAGVVGDDRPAYGVVRSPAKPADGQRPRHGLVRRTETVHVTTRQTIVDQHEDHPGAGHDGVGGDWYGGGRRPARDRPGPDAWHDDHHRGGERRRDTGWRHEPPSRETWRRDADQSDAWERRDDRRVGWESGAASGDGRERGERGQRGEAERPDPRYGGDRHWQRGGGGADLPWAGSPAGGGDVRFGDRWATARRDDRGDEVRLGERYAAMRTDPTGAELRMGDRWASVRLDRPMTDTTATTRRDTRRAADYRELPATYREFPAEQVDRPGTGDYWSPSDQPAAIGAAAARYWSDVDREPSRRDRQWPGRQR
ncbi:hypothetical protein [Plantactinospora sp. GCM10030261]|uniref:hypothetical protein n=1 Tax=Plantactinospora sp. GCM10030261 TaxID=3273420 RepID=UPI00360822BE